MRTTTLALPTAVIVVGLSLTGCSSGSTKKASDHPTGSSTASSLKIATFQYAPTPLTVTAGASVPVMNTDGATHTVTSDMAGLFLADDIGSGKTVTFTAPKTAGTYTFHCEYHKSMHGTLVVT